MEIETLTLTMLRMPIAFAAGLGATAVFFWLTGRKIDRELSSPDGRIATAYSVKQGGLVESRAGKVDGPYWNRWNSLGAAAVGAVIVTISLLLPREANLWHVSYNQIASDMACVWLSFFTIAMIASGLVTRAVVQVVGRSRDRAWDGAVGRALERFLVLSREADPISGSPVILRPLVGRIVDRIAADPLAPRSDPRPLRDLIAACTREAESRLREVRAFRARLGAMRRLYELQIGFFAMTGSLTLVAEADSIADAIEALEDAYFQSGVLDTAGARTAEIERRLERLQRIATAYPPRHPIDETLPIPRLLDLALDSDPLPGVLRGRKEVELEPWGSLWEDDLGAAWRKALKEVAESSSLELPGTETPVRTGVSTEVSAKGEIATEASR